MHHRAEPDSSYRREHGSVCGFHILRKFRIAILQSRPNIIQAVCPNSIFQPVFPVMAAGCDRLILFPDQNCLDPRRAKLNAQRRLSALYRRPYAFFCNPHVSYPPNSVDTKSQLTFSFIISYLWLHFNLFLAILKQPYHNLHRKCHDPCHADLENHDK